MSEPHLASTKAPWRLAMVVLVVGALVRLFFAARLPLFPDEAYYWDWSRHLAAGYFDHPPAIPLLIRAGTAMLGTTPFAVRLFPVLAGLVASLAVTATARRLAGDHAALLAAITITCLPLAAAGLVLATPDAPLFAATSVGVYAVVRALQTVPSSRESLRWWIAAGVALGLAFSSKYTSILLPVGITVAVLLRRDLRARLREPGPYVACVAATLVFLPVLIWNANHEWISFGFQLRHGLGPSKASALAPLKRLGDLFGGQAGLASPILFALFGVVTWRALRWPRDAVRFALAVVGTVVFLFFCWSATRQRVEANWPALAYIPMIALLASYTWSQRGERWLRAGIWLAGITSGIIYLHAAFAILPIPPRKDPLARSAGWDLVAQQAAATQRDVNARARASTTDAASTSDSVATWLGADRYQDAAELAFYAPGHPETFSMNLSGRYNQYDLWPRFPERARVGDHLVLVLDESVEPHGTAVRLTPYFATVARGALLELASPRGVVSRRRLWILRGWNGAWPRSELGGGAGGSPSRPYAVEQLHQRPLIGAAERRD